MPLRHRGFVELPAHAKPGGFDHAAVHEPTGRTYVAHTANDAVDILDVEARQYLGSIRDLRRQLASARVKAPPLGQWHTVRVVAIGDHIQAWLDGAL
jgi:hypothetical protein